MKADQKCCYLFLLLFYNDWDASQDDLPEICLDGTYQGMNSVFLLRGETDQT